MAKQTFTTGQVLTAAQMTNLQQTAMLGGAANARTASYVLVAGDAGNCVSMNNAGATTITVNTGLFAAGDIVTIINIGAGTCTITAGTATVSKPTASSLALAQNEGGVLYFTSSSAATFLPFNQGSNALTLISTTTLSDGSGAHDISVPSGYTYIEAWFVGLTSNASTQLGVFPNNNTADGYDTNIIGTTIFENYAGATRLNYNRSGLNSGTSNFRYRLDNYTSTAQRKIFSWTGLFYDNTAAAIRTANGAGGWANTSAVTSLRISNYAGSTWSAGSVLLYGVK